MATIDLGKIKMVWRGTYNNGTAYVVDDVVEYTDTAITSTYICTTASTGNAPSSGGTAHGSWAYMAKGAQGTPTTTRGDIIYRGASADQRLAKGSSGQVLKMGANDPEWGTDAGGLTSQQIFGVGSHTYTKPSGITKIKVYVTGGGASGAGGASSAITDFGAGGGAGGTAIELIPATSINTVSVTVGAGGGAVSGTNDGNSGGSSSFGSYCSATGGAVGRHGNRGYIIGGAGGTATGGDLNLYGGAGSGGSDGANQHLTGGTGGSSYWGGAGLGQAGSSHTGTAATRAGYNGSGGGGACNAGTSGAGGSGIVVVEEYK